MAMENLARVIRLARRWPVFAVLPTDRSRIAFRPVVTCCPPCASGPDYQSRLFHSGILRPRMWHADHKHPTFMTIPFQTPHCSALVQRETQRPSPDCRGQATTPDQTIDHERGSFQSIDMIL